VNCAQTTEVNVPFGGYKQSGIGRELGQYALDTYVFNMIVVGGSRMVLTEFWCALQVYAGEGRSCEYWGEVVRWTGGLGRLRCPVRDHDGNRQTNY
jgi:Aldehyde dehydrogenase family